MTDDTPSAIPRALLERTAGLPAFRAPPRTAEVRLHLNEPSFPPSPRVVEVLRAAGNLLGRYPDGGGTLLREALASRLGVAPECIVLGAGSDELIGLSVAAFVAPGAGCVVPVPSFPRYRTCALFQGAIPLECPVGADGALDVEAMVAASEGAALVFAATPNNPTGGLLERPRLERLATGVAAGTLLVLDEAYFEFGRAAGGPDGLEVLRGRKGPWLLLRTFSKAYGLAGLRVGYALASDPRLAEALNRARGMFNVSALAQAAALAAWEDAGYARTQIEKTVASREALRAALSRLGIECLPSAANFLAAKLAVPAAQAMPLLAAEGIFVSGVGGPPFERHIRITVGTDADHARLLAALERLPRA